MDATPELVADLQKAVGLEQVKFDQMTRLLYSTDASNYQIIPIGVTFPRDADDVVAIHDVANKHHIPLLPRGTGSSLGGQTVGQAVIMDFSRHMRRVRSINAEAQCVTVEPGIILDVLNRQLTSLRLMFGPDPATADRATIGGCIGNNSSGSHSILYRMTADHVKRLEVVLASGEKVWLDAHNTTLDTLRAKIGSLAAENAAEIAARYPKTWRSVSGYALNKIDPNAVNLAWLFAGSEGTLGTLVQAELNLVPVPPMKRLAILHFDRMRAALDITPRILETNPSAVELMDRFLLNRTRANPAFAPLMTAVEGDPEALLVVEYYGNTEAELAHNVDGLLALLQHTGYSGAVTHAISASEQAKVWKIRKAGLGLIMSERSESKPISFIEDAAVPVDRLGDYADDIQRIVAKAGTTCSIYGHASAGCLHIRPLVNLKTTTGFRQYRQIADAVAELVLKYEGTITGEHGEGLVRGEYSPRLFGPVLTAAFREIKRAFDPDNRMNPGKVVDVGPMDNPALMRYTPDYQVIPVRTRFDWSADHGLNGAAEMCNGSGVCRKEDTGTMCPSYMATRDEHDVTRGRANALRLAMSGHFGKDGLGSPALDEVFALCLSCKACKTECPTSVDVARMKSEFLAAHHDIHGIPLKTRIFANIHRLNRLGMIWPAFSNFVLGSAIGRFGFRLVSIPADRPLPKLATSRFSRMAKAEATWAHATLIIDTYTEYNQPQIGLALLKIAAALGVRLNLMRLPGEGCCGRPAISKGMLDHAKKLATDNVRYLSARLDAGPFLFLEPSCQSTFVDDYLTLVDASLQAQAAQVAKQCLSVEAWLVQQLQQLQQSQGVAWDNRPREILFHGHCHQKALWGTQHTLQLLRAIPQATVSEIDSGCCGVAGSFGYEHYDLSMKIARSRLLPAIEAKPDAIIVAPGTSCRTQIAESGRRVWHPVEVVADALRG